jgi:biotin transporter BioY
MERAFALGILPFIIGDLIKLILAALVLPVAWKFVR